MPTATSWLWRPGPTQVQGLGSPPSDVWLGAGEAPWGLAETQASLPEHGPEQLEKQSLQVRTVSKRSALLPP